MPLHKIISFLLVASLLLLISCRKDEDGSPKKKNEEEIEYFQVKTFERITKYYNATPGLSKTVTEYTYFHDELGREIEMKGYIDGQWRIWYRHYQHDVKGRVVYKEIWKAADNVKEGLLKYEYDQFGNLISDLYANADETPSREQRQEYDGQNRLIHIGLYIKDTLVNEAKEFTHNSKGKETSFKRYYPIGTHHSTTELSYLHDTLLIRSATQEHDNSPDHIEQLWEYDSLGREIGYTFKPNYSIYEEKRDYNYDENDNLLEYVVVSSNGDLKEKVEYHYKSFEKNSDN